MSDREVSIMNIKIAVELGRITNCEGLKLLIKVYER